MPSVEQRERGRETMEGDYLYLFPLWHGNCSHFTELRENADRDEEAGGASCDGFISHKMLDFAESDGTIN